MVISMPSMTAKELSSVKGRVDHMDAKLDAILKHLNIPVPDARALVAMDDYYGCGDQGSESSQGG